MHQLFQTALFGLMDDLPTLAFDHNQILEMAYQRLQNKLQYQPIGFELLPQKFSLTQLQNLYEKLLGRTMDKRNFRKKILAMGILDELVEVETHVAHRASRLYRRSCQSADDQVRPCHCNSGLATDYCVRFTALHSV